MDFIFSFIITFVLLYAGLYIWTQWAQSTNSITHEQLQEAVDAIQDAMLMCNVEKEGDVYYFYNAIDQSFVGQGKTGQDIVDISMRLEKHIVVVGGDDDIINEIKRISDETSTSQ